MSKIAHRCALRKGEICVGDFAHASPGSGTLRGQTRTTRRIKKTSSSACLPTLRRPPRTGHILIQICDDGRGLDTGLIGAKAVALGLVSEAELGTLTEAQVHRFIFAPGFSTADTVTSVSG